MCNFGHHVQIWEINVLKLFAVDMQKKKKEKSKGITLRLTWGILLGSFSAELL